MQSRQLLHEYAILPSRCFLSLNTFVERVGVQEPSITLWVHKSSSLIDA